MCSLLNQMNNQFDDEVTLSERKNEPKLRTTSQGCPEHLYRPNMNSNCRHDITLRQNEWCIPQDLLTSTSTSKGNILSLSPDARASISQPFLSVSNKSSAICWPFQWTGPPSTPMPRCLFLKTSGSAHRRF